jgi:tetratricopeptide (TPR) repeat protein
MTRVVCPICRTAFEAPISRRDYAINCISCGVAFNAASFLPEDEFRAMSERRPAAGSPSPYDRGTHALGSLIRPAPPTAYSEPLTPDTRTGGLPFMYQDAGAAVGAPAPGQEASPPPAPAPRRPAPRSFLEASATTGRFRPPQATPAPSGEATGAGQAATPAGASQAGSSQDVAAAGERRDELRPRTWQPRPQAPHPPSASQPVFKSWLERPPAPHKTPPPAPAAAIAPLAPLPQAHTPPAPQAAAAPKMAAAAGPPRWRPLLEGTFGPFEIEEEIARGGVGAVFRAREAATGKCVALKILLDGAEADGVDRERFRRECETAKSLGLPGMVQVLAVGEVDQRPFMAMELVEGHSLDELISDKSLSVHDALVLMQTVAETAGALHEAGYVHRDIKPANILLDACGSPKLADFGLVKSLDEVTRLTAAGLVCGTPAYMSPEQARGEGQAIDSRTDVWALGAVLYEVLTGAPPFHADNALRLMLRITKEAPRLPRQLNPKVPREVENIVLKCLEKNAERRYPNGRALAADLKRFLEGKPVEARRTRTVQRLLARTRQRRGVVVGVGVGLLAVALVALLVRFALRPMDALGEDARGWEAVRGERLSEAEGAFRSAIRQDPRHAHAHLGLGLVVGSQSVDVARRRVRDPLRFQEALTFTRLAGELDSRLAAQAASQAARLYMAAGLYAEEVRERERAVALQSDNPDYYQALGLAYWNLGGPLTAEALSPGQRECYRKALAALNTVLTLSPEYPKTREYMKMLQERFLSRPVQNLSLATH